MKLSLKTNLRLGLGLSLFLLMLSSVASYISIKNLIEASELVAHSNTVSANAENIISSLKDAETGQRGYLLTKNRIFLEPYNGSKERINGFINVIRESTKDNSVQTQKIAELSEILNSRLTVIDKTIVLKAEGGIVTEEMLLQGKFYMDKCRSLIKEIQGEEKRLLTTRTQELKAFSEYTPLMIIISAILAMGITFFFYRKVSADFDERTGLYDQLQTINTDTATRITTIQNIAREISNGNYDIRVDDSQKDTLGTLAGSLNSMARALSDAFNQLNDKEWLQTGMANLNAKMVGEKEIKQLTADILESLVAHTRSSVGAFYLVDDDRMLNFVSGYAFVPKDTQRRFAIGEGLIGQVVQSQKLILITDLPDDEGTISFATGQVRPKNVIALPIHRDGVMIGAIELASLNAFNGRKVEFLATVEQTIGIAIHVAQNRKRLQEFLEETQAQAEELQAQHSELEGLNAELEAQTQKIQASEEELRVQQEELLQSNQELEERTALLEERNVLIQERNAEIQQKAAELEQSTKYKSEFLANMSHELRTPLNSILLLSRLMADNEDLDAEVTEYATVIQSSGRGLLNLIDEILDLSKIEAGKMEIEVGEIKLADAVKELTQLFNPIAANKGLELVVDLDKDTPETITTDQMRLEQILKNLLSNALKFTSQGKIQLSIKPDLRYKTISFGVKDSGIGIPKDKQALVFEAFQQADGSTKRKFGGTGLGLSISRELAKLLGGQISLESEEGQGAEFTLTIPIHYTDNEAYLEEQRAHEELESKKEEIIITTAPVSTLVVDRIPNEVADDRENILPNDKVILIIEDDTPFAKTLLDFTRKRNYKGIVAVRGDVGIEMANHYNPLAILLDIQLPIKDGWQVMEELKSNPKTRPIPVHIMSSLQAKKESLLKGAVDFINKPFALEHMKQIFEKLEEALSRSPKKVLIVEENEQHAKALSYFLSNANIQTMVVSNVNESIQALTNKEGDCVFLDMGIPDKTAYETLETIKQHDGLEHLPIIIFTGKNLSKGEERRIKQYADSIVVKTAHSYQRILDEAGLFLHLVEEQGKSKREPIALEIGGMHDILNDKVVLVADDDVRNIFSLTKALEKHKMKVVAAVDGKEALKALDENNQVDVVLMDMMMPELDGYETTRAIRNNPKYRNLPILAVTAKAMMGDREKCIAAGASDYISKPVDVDQLISLLRVWLYNKS